MSNPYIHLGNGVTVTTRQVVMMVSIFKNASKDLLKTVDWTAVSREMGHASRRVARDTFTTRCKGKGWLKGGVTILPVSGASGAAPVVAPPAVVPAVVPAIPNAAPATGPTTTPAAAPPAPAPAPVPAPAALPAAAPAPRRRRARGILHRARQGRVSKSHVSRP
ncbi:uncharacterized protein F4817DRAFT_363468 [Daldinia loculata]|uniref:uncharacterized protein n=1 Tax=Daldinia loculata TaxID=103429 RepID=UPI0020C33B54|nr:uncharacterized protein F4817DRAFT_363468 [Daldinia loculata]KAI1649561.1 hypothetical protein F4817DRAFT_363468 [Daldinia loculata]